MRTFFRLLGWLRPYPGLLLASFVAMIAFAIVDGFSIVLLIPFLRVLFRGGSIAEAAPPVPDDLFGRLEHLVRYELFAWLDTGSPLETLMNVCLLIIGVYFLKSALNYLQLFLPELAIERGVRDLRDDLFAHLQGLSFRWYQKTRAGQLLSILANDTQMLAVAIRTGLFRVGRNVLEAVVTITILLAISWQLTLIALAILPPIMWVVARLGKKLHRVNRQRLQTFGDVTSRLQESVAGIRVVKAFGAESFERERFAKSTGGYYRHVVRTQKYAIMGTPVSEFLLALSVVVVLYIGGRMILVGGTLDPEPFIVFIAAALKLSSPIKYLSKLNEDVQPAIAASERIFGVLDTAPEVVERPEAAPVGTFRDSIVYDHVWFAYEDHEGPVLEDIAFTIEKGQVVALVGPSGGGKSTLVDLLPRFYDPQEGRILFDGVDLRDVRIADLRAQMGIVTQEVILFHDTVAANIAYGRRMDPERLQEAAVAANALEFIEELPEGFDTVIGERGVRLSGGQRQRLAIARAIYKNPSILIFDEATSALDTESEQLVQQAIARLMENRTSIVIAHRLSTVLHADQILVIEDGRIVERGTHDELLARGGRYTRLYELQFADLPA
ncbi:MAG: ATP-binding cassette domain-containing protein [Gemmatimonadetes bacterium]|nr:ATP-binding cassette domain-containing protein [Gemmatimonadota bacterium]